MTLTKAFILAMIFSISVVSKRAAAEAPDRSDGISVETLPTSSFDRDERELDSTGSQDSQGIREISHQNNRPITDAETQKAIELTSQDTNLQDNQQSADDRVKPIKFAAQDAPWPEQSFGDVHGSQRSSRPYTWYHEGRAGWGKRDLYLSPVLSLFLPGFDQWWEGQYAAATFYSGSKLLAHRATQNAKKLFLSSEDVDRINNEIEQGMETQSNELRRIYLYSQFQLMTGGLSLYHAFRTAAESRPQDFAFISKKETFSDLMLAPFDLTHFAKPTTYIPLAGLAALFWAENASQKTTADSKYRAIKLGGDDILFSGMFSYNAGTYEEMVFRGWLQPVVYYETNNALTANLANSLIFGLAHRNNVKFPIIQMGLGYYLGWLTMENSWTLSESIFVHSWWDLLAFLQSYHYERKNPGTQAYWLPGVNLAW